MSVLTSQTKRFVTIVVIGVIALMAGFGGAWLHSATDRPTAQVNLHDLMHTKLKLDATQHTKLDAIEQAFEAQRATLENQMRLANRELADAMAQDKAYTQGVQTAIDHFHHAMGDLQKATIEHVFAMRAILTPAQQVTFDSQVRAALIASGQGDDNAQQGR